MNKATCLYHGNLILHLQQQPENITLATYAPYPSLSLILMSSYLI
ncbi:MAG: hypothetical protein QNJ54_30235 [Prochloraceae cyanobacterium]|nr:hypothetical protein [Prochloraceae cyanobacterium]